MEISKLKPKIRYLSEMKEVLFDKKWSQTADPDLELYYMYRDLSENQNDHQLIEQADLRYDITVLNPITLGQEYNKTAGHDHPFVPGTTLTYPEIYQVLKGEAIFLVQDSKEDRIQDIYAVQAKDKDIVIIPPNYEHLIINISGQKLFTANWICRKFTSNIYQPFRDKRGFSYFALQDKNSNNKIKWVKNHNYTIIPPLRFAAPNLWLDKFKIDKIDKKEMYQLINNLGKLNFLKEPQRYNWLQF